MLDLSEFIEIYNVEINLPKIDDKDIYIHNINPNTHYIYDINDIRVNGHFIERFYYNNQINSTVYHDNKIRFTKYSCDTIMYPCLFNINIEDQGYEDNLYNYNYFLNNRYKNANYIGILMKTDDKYFIIYYTSKKILNSIIENKYNSKTYTLLTLLDYKNNKQLKDKLLHSLDNIMNNIPEKSYNNKTFDFLKDDVNLYNYQKNDIEWMSNIKHNIDSNDNNIEYIYNDFNQITLDNINYVINGNLLLRNVDINAFNDSIEIIKYYGGNIISSVGLGKTIIVLCYLLNHSDNNYNQYIKYDNTFCNYFYKRGKNKGTSCTKLKKNNDLYCVEHNKTLFIDKRITTLDTTLLIDKFSLRDIVVNECYFKSNANLIICPNQLADQWVREYYEKFKQDDIYKKRILLIVTYDQYRNLTFANILFADIIIISYNFLLNTNYNKIKKKPILNILDEIDQKDDINSIVDIMNIFNPQLNMLCNFYYKSVILDEFHEVTQPRLIDNILSFQSIYKWNISATPFANGSASFKNGLDFITNINNHNNNIINKCKTIQNFNILYRRNTRESVKDDYTSTIINDNLQLLDFTDQERRIYNAHSIDKISHRNFLIKLCCDTSINLDTKSLIKNCKSLDEIEAVILNFNKKKLNTIKQKINKSQSQIEELLVITKRGYIDPGFMFENILLDTIEDVKLELGSCRRRLTNQKKEYDDVFRTYTFLKNAIDNIKIKDTCPICLDDIQDDSIAITQCGHKFCKECIHEYINQTYSSKCPKCNIPIKLDEIYLLEEKIECKIDNDLNNIIQRVKSTKIGNIIYYIKNKLKNGDKCIIFSQWNEILVKVSKFLTSEKIPTLFCTGTVYNRKKSIDSFQKNPKTNVICLSSVNCASGINLTAANKIIFIEPIYGSKEYRKDIENQASGRANRLGQTRDIEVLRFIIKDSIEEEIYNDNEKDNVLINTENILVL
jgi:SNF2 family DNA or RNA helicase